MRAGYANIASAVGVAQYVAIADALARALPGGRVLDWGAGWGQTSLLLWSRELRVVACDVEDKGAAAGLLRGHRPDPLRAAGAPAVGHHLGAGRPPTLA